MGDNGLKIKKIVLLVSLLLYFQGTVFSTTLEELSTCPEIGLEASFLLWKLSGDELEYAAKKKSTTHTTSSPISFFYKERAYRLKPGFHPGVRLEAFLLEPCYNLDARAIYTHFTSKTRSSTKAAAPSATNELVLLLPNLEDSSQLISPMSSSNPTRSIEIKGKGRFSFDVVDLHLGRWFSNECESAFFCPFAGLRLAEISNTCESRTRPLNFTSPSITKIKFHVNNHADGVGPLLGLKTRFFMTECVAFEINAGGSVLFPKTKVSHRYSVVNSSPTTQAISVPDGTGKERFRSPLWMTDLVLSLKALNLDICGYCFSFAISWEHHYLARFQHHFIQGSVLSRSSTVVGWKTGNLSLQGVTLTGGIEF